ncbi:MAG: molybdopterin cofactor-binding domain-containing protein [Anaerolineales bacterium]|nr:molybdopterin cofactor-binding domain-containing protein [Anaerolineales bacterium]
MDELRLTVNGQERTAVVEPGEMLASVLREKLGLTGTKIGCDELECGSCTVLLDGEPVLACGLPAMRAAGRSVTTIEGLASNGSLHPLQEAFVKQGAVQCGFCIPGQIMTAAALLDRDPDPSREEVRAALKDTLCRCAGYPSIERAVESAAEAMRTGEPIEFPPLVESSDTEVVGHLVERPDAYEKVTGEALFADDLTFPGMLHGRALRAGVPHAIVKRLNIEAAQSHPGVRAVLTAEDVPGEPTHGLIYRDWPHLIGVGEKVRYVGDAVALVAADTRRQATEALELIEVEYEPLPVIDDPVLAHREDAPQVHEDGNLLKHIKVRKGDVQRGLDAADVVFEETYHTAITEHAYIEPECSLARPIENGRMEVFVGSQIPYADREQIAAALGVPQDEVRVRGTLIGGGFGGKEDIAGQIHAALLARATGKPVKILYDRHESLLVHPKRHATQIRVRVGAKEDGTLTAFETELYGDTGAYASLGDKVMTRATTHSSGPYEVEHVRADCYAMYTNNPPAGAFRGFGVTQSAFAVESAIDSLAHKLGIDPVELRRRNALAVGSVTNTGQELRESVGLPECIDRLEEEIRRRQPDGDPFSPQPVPDAPHRVRSWGLALAYKNTGLGGGAPDKSSAEVELYEDGHAEVRTSAAEIGQGLVAVAQMITAEELALPLDQVRVLLSDTDLTPDGGPTTASRQTYVTGNAVRYASRTVRDAVSAALAEKYDVPPGEIRFEEGLAQVNGHKVPLGQAVEMLKAEGREAKATYEYWAPDTQPLGEGGDMHFAFSFAAQAAQVEVDTLTGEVEVLSVIAVNDVGKIINPLGLLGQVEGGVMMGLGNALTERFIVEEGRVFSDRLARYRMPKIEHTPEIVSVPLEHPTTDGPYGAKGIGEISSIPITPAITNAIFNAIGVRIRDLPVDQDRLARTIKGELEDYSDPSS